MPNWQGDEETCARARFGMHRDFAPVFPDDFLRYGQSQPRAFRAFRAEEGGKYLLQVFLALILQVSLKLLT